MPLTNIAVSQDASQVSFQPITISTLAELQALIANPPEAGFAPVIIAVKTRAALANILGALLAYGTANVYAENGLKKIGLGEFYTGNVRGAARDYAKQIAEAAGVNTPDFSDYIGSVKFRTSLKSQAGTKVRGTEEDMAPGYSPTTFEEPLTGETEASGDNEPVAEAVGTSQVW